MFERIPRATRDRRLECDNRTGAVAARLLDPGRPARSARRFGGRAKKPRGSQPDRIAPCLCEGLNRGHQHNVHCRRRVTFLASGRMQAPERAAERLPPLKYLSEIQRSSNMTPYFRNVTNMARVGIPFDSRGRGHGFVGYDSDTGPESGS